MIGQVRGAITSILSQRLDYQRIASPNRTDGNRRDRPQRLVSVLVNANEKNLKKGKDRSPFRCSGAYQNLPRCGADGGMSPPSSATRTPSATEAVPSPLSVTSCRHVVPSEYSDHHVMTMPECVVARKPVRPLRAGFLSIDVMSNERSRVGACIADSKVGTSSAAARREAEGFCLAEAFLTTCCLGMITVLMSLRMKTRGV